MANDLYPSGGSASLTAAALLLRLSGAATLAAGALLFGAGTATLSTLPIGAANTVLTSSGSAPQWSTALALTSTIASKQAAAAGVSLDHNSATGNFTLRLSPANLAANRRATFPDADFTVAGLSIAQTFTASQAISVAGNADLQIQTTTVGSAATSSLTLSGSSGALWAVGAYAGNIVPKSFFIYDNVNALNAFLINPGIVSAGQVFFPYTLDASSKDAAAMVLEGGLAVEKKIIAGIGFGVGSAPTSSVPLILVGSNAGTYGASIQNTSGGVGAGASYTAANDTGLSASFGVNGSAYGTYGIFGNNSAIIYSGNAAGLSLMSDNVAGSIKFASGGNIQTVAFSGTVAAGGAAFAYTTDATSSTVAGVTTSSGLAAAKSIFAGGDITAFKAATQQIYLTQRAATTSTTLGDKDSRLFCRLDSGTVGAGGEVVLGAVADTATGRYASISASILTNAAGAASGSIVLSTKTLGADTALLPRVTVSASGFFATSATTSTTSSTDATHTFANNSTGTPAASYGMTWAYNLKSSTTNDQSAAAVNVNWVVATHASRAARVTHFVYDTAVRECLRLEASGTAPMIGFLGASAVVRPTSTADLRQSLIDLGLYTTGGATPLSLNGGALTAAQAVLTTGTITTSQPAIDATQTWNGGGVTFTGWKLNVTNTASASSSLLLDLQVGGFSRLEVGVAGNLTSTISVAATNSISQVFNGLMRSTGTPAAGFGIQWGHYLQSSTTNDMAGMALSTEWVDATHATRKARSKISVYDTAARECLRLEASGSAAMIGFLGANAVVRATMAAATGTATRTAFATSTVTTAQLAEAVKALIDDFRSYGLHG